jgi:hypothetical protein
MGGAGTFSAIGARLFSPPPRSKSVGWIIDAGTDFPDELRTFTTTQRPYDTRLEWLRRERPSSLQIPD